MPESIVLIYDGQCPFCNMFAQLVELKGHIPCLSIKNGRSDISQLTLLYNKGYDLDKGAILLKDGEVLHGASAVNWICSQMSEPSSALLEILKVLFASKESTNFIFPLLIWSRRIVLFMKGVKAKPV
mgnify:CR=1 FL=1